MSVAKPHVVLLGGGNGTSQLLRALLPLLRDGSIGSLYALVQMADDGGSTGRLRDQYGVAAMGDLTKCLLALSGLAGDVRGDEFLRALEYRFENGDFQGHTLRNIFLTALEKTQPSPEASSGTPAGEASMSTIDTAIATMARVLQVPKYAGVVPTTLTCLTEQVVIEFDGKESVLGVGQHSISHRVNLQADPRWRPGDVRVQFAEGNVPLNPRAEQILEQATHIVVAPGHTYGTILPTLAVPALGRAVAAGGAELWVVMTLLTTPRQTEGWRGEDFVRVYESYLGRSVDGVLTNTAPLAGIALVAGQDWVHFTEAEHSYRLIREELVAAARPVVQQGDVVPRAVAVHEAGKVEAVLRDLVGAAVYTGEHGSGQQGSGDAPAGVDG